MLLPGTLAASTHTNELYIVISVYTTDIDNNSYKRVTYITCWKGTAQLHDNLFTSYGIQWFKIHTVCKADD